MQDAHELVQTLRGTEAGGAGADDKDVDVAGGVSCDQWEA